MNVMAFQGEYKILIDNFGNKKWFRTREMQIR